MSVAINLLPPEYRPRQREPLSRGLLVAFIAGELSFYSTWPSWARCSLFPGGWP